MFPICVRNNWQDADLQLFVENKISGPQVVPDALISVGTLHTTHQVLQLPGATRQFQTKARIKKPNSAQQGPYPYSLEGTILF